MISKKDVVSGIHGNLSVSMFQIFLVKETSGALGENKVHKIGRTRQGKMERLIEVGICGNAIVNGGAWRKTEVQHDTPFGAILMDSLQRRHADRGCERIAREWPSSSRMSELCR